MGKAASHRTKAVGGGDSLGSNIITSAENSATIITTSAVNVNDSNVDVSNNISISGRNANTCVSAKSDAAKTDATIPTSKKAAAKTKKDIMSDPRLIDFMERSEYEAYIDPYRGMFPFFHLSFPIEDATIDNSCVSNEKTSFFEPGQNVFVDGHHAAVIVSMCESKKTAVVKWATCQKKDTVNIDQITSMDTGKTRSGRTCTVGNAEDTKRTLNETMMQRQMLDDKPSPWKKCSDSLSSSTWQTMNRDGVQVINVDNPAKDIQKTTTLVLCNCSSVNEWAKSEYECLTKERMAELKKGKKKKGRKKKDVAVLERGMDVVENNPSDVEKHSIVCGRREVGNCICDYNPFCLASIGGIFDEYRYNVARVKRILLEDESSTFCATRFSALLRENWTDLPGKMKKEAASNEKQEQSSPIRSIVMVERHKVESHLSINVSTTEENLTVERCMSMLLSHHKVMIMSSTQVQVTVCNSNIQLSKPPGLRNLGATCYLNSQLQCLAMNLGFMHGLLAWKPTLPDTNDARILASASRMNDVLTSMQSILARMRYGHENIICTHEFALNLGLENDEMQDPNEFAGLLFDKIHDSFKQCTNKNSNQAELENLLPSIYWGKSSISTTCSVCKFSSKRVDDFKFLSIPIQNELCDEGTFRGSGISNDVDVQQLLDLSLHCEVLDGDNQYFCSICNKKCDAIRHPSFEALPPVLNLQLNRYIFDMKSFSKQKCTTKVLLPHLLTVPMEEGRKEYILVAVQNHLGNSAHGGHYVANVMDWNTGVWFEFNDEDVDVLDEGPLSSFHPRHANNGEDTLQKTSGSADAYNLLYVDKKYFARSVQTNLEYCEKEDAACNESLSNPRSAELEDNTYQFYSKMRLKQFRLVNEEHMKQSKQKARLAFRKTQLIDKLFCSQHEKSFDSSKSIDCNVLVDSDVLKRIFSCNDALDDVFRSVITNKSSFCQHSSGIHPTTAVKFKLLPKEVFGIISSILASESKMLLEDEHNSTNINFNANDLALHDNQMICQHCSTSYQAELRQRYMLLENLVAVYEEFHSKSSDLNIDPDFNEALCVISKRFVTSYCKYVEGIIKNMFNTPKPELQHMPQRGDLSSLDLSEILSEDASVGFTHKGTIDIAVNSNITCEHGNCFLMHNQRSSRIVPLSLWTKITKIFPNAIRHNYLPSSDDCIGNCRECYREKEVEDLFPYKIKEWKSSIDKDPALLEIFRNVYHLTAQEANVFYLLHHDQVQGWRDSYSYLLRSKKNVSNQTIRQRLIQMCPSLISLLVCHKHKKTVGIPPLQLSEDTQHNVEILKQCNVEMITEESYCALMKSITCLDEILREHDPSPDILVPIQPPMVIKSEANDDDLLIQIQPEYCHQGCVCSASKMETEREQLTVDSVDLTVSDAKPEEERESQVFNVLIHEVESSIDLQVAGSIIFADLTAEKAETQQRRSRRKMKDRNFPCYSVKVPVDCNIAYLRLKVHEKTGRRLLNQRLHVLTGNSDDQIICVLDLHERDNSKDLKDFVTSPTNTVCHIIISYQDAESVGDNVAGTRTRKRHGKIDIEAEEIILSTLTEIAFQGMENVDKGRKTKRRREERGFRGTFLQSSPNNDTENGNEAARVVIDCDD